MIVRTKAHMFYFTLFLTPSSKKCSRKYSNHYFKTLFFKFLYMLPHKLFHPTIPFKIKKIHDKKAAPALRCHIKSHGVNDTVESDSAVSMAP